MKSGKICVHTDLATVVLVDADSLKGNHVLYIAGLRLNGRSRIRNKLSRMQTRIRYHKMYAKQIS